MLQLSSLLSKFLQNLLVLLVRVEPISHMLGKKRTLKTELILLGSVVRRRRIVSVEHFATIEVWTIDEHQLYCIML